MERHFLLCVVESIYSLWLKGKFVRWLGPGESLGGGGRALTAPYCVFLLAAL